MANQKRRGERGPPTQMSVLRAFSVDHAARVTGLSKSRLTRWDKLGFFSPEYIDPEDRGNPYARVYSYTDLVGLRTLAILTGKDYRVPVSELRKTYPELAKAVQNPWANAKLAVWQHRVVWDLDKVPRDRHGQYLGRHIELPSIAEEVTRNANELRERPKGTIGTFTQHKYVAHNALVVAGTRIPVSAVQEFIEEGFSDTEIVAQYPTLTAKDVRAVRAMTRRAA